MRVFKRNLWNNEWFFFFSFFLLWDESWGWVKKIIVWNFESILNYWSVGTGKLVGGGIVLEAGTVQ